MVTIKTSGRVPDEAFFKHIQDSDDSSHYPFLVFDTDNDEVNIVLESSMKDVLKYSDDTKVMKQWGGKWSSDFFQFTVRDLRLLQDEESKEFLQMIKNCDSILVRASPTGIIKDITVYDSDYEYGSEYISNIELFWEIVLKEDTSLICIEQEKWGVYGTEKMPYKDWVPGRRY